MIHILFTVLKIIGILLIVFLSILILALGLILFVPAQYVIEAKAENGLDDLVFEAKAHWILHLFSMYYIYQEKKSDWQVRIGWRKLNQPDVKNNKSESAKPVESCEEDCKAEPDNRETTSGMDTDTAIHPKKKKKCTILMICARIKSLWETKDKFTQFFTDNIHVEAFHTVKSEIVKLAKHWHPRRIHGCVEYGFEDPCHTGQLLALLSILYPFFGDNVEITPDFENKVLIGDLHIKGHIRLCHLLMAIKVLFFNRKVRKTYEDYKKIKL